VYIIIIYLDKYLNNILTGKKILLASHKHVVNTDGRYLKMASG